MTAKTRTPKKVYKPEIKAVDAAASLYTVSSERYTYILYEVNVFEQTCTCDAAKWGRVACKHRSIVADFHAALHAPKPRPISETCQHCGAQYYGVPVSSWCTCDGAAKARNPYGKAAGLMEVFGL